MNKKTVTRAKRKSENNDVISLGAFDFETDPFEYGREVKPFCVGLKLADEYWSAWGDDCAEQLVNRLRDIQTPLHLYAHNGGKFDFLFLTRWLENPIMVISGRIVKAKLGIHTLLDSYAIVPTSLAVAGNKLEIDINKLHVDHRAEHQREIMDYLQQDCETLLSLAQRFHDRFGYELTIAATAIKQLKKQHDIVMLDEHHHARFQDYYFGGRVECIERGILQGDFVVVDVNSMYPHVMKTYDHPSGPCYEFCDNLETLLSAPVAFARVNATNLGLLPQRLTKPTPKLDFTVERGEFYCCSHELKLGLESGLLCDIELIEGWIPTTTQNFSNFVDNAMSEKIKAEQSGDKTGRLFAKLIANSAYGKFAQNPERYQDYLLWRQGDRAPSNDYEIYLQQDDDNLIYRRPAPSRWGYYDIAIAASITSAARAELMRGILQCGRAVYCDTDSIICERFDGVTDSVKIGAWKIEAQGTHLAIAGKKMYALIDNESQTVKLASKGARLRAKDIFALAKGQKITWRKDSPVIKLDGSQKFIERTIQSTF